MKSTVRLIVAALVVLATEDVARAFTIAEKGKPRGTIVVAAEALKAEKGSPAEKVKIAAEELRHYVEKISGASLRIVDDGTEPTGPLILVGRSRLTESRHIDIPDGLTTSRAEEGFLVECRGDGLILAGNDRGPYHGTEYAVSDLLERLGVRWFMPGDFGECVPESPTLDVAELSFRSKPDFILRNWWLHTTPEMLEAERRWKIRNRMNPDELFALAGDSTVRNFTADPKLAATRPELFAKKLDGTPDPYLPNLTNPEAVKIAADKMKAFFREHPAASSVGIAPDDGLPRDFTHETQERNQGFTDILGREGVPTEASTSEEWIGFVNAVARQVRAEFPDRIITTNGYANRNTPPEGVAIEPNVSIMFAAIWSDNLHAYDDPKSWQAVRQGQMLRRWCELCPRAFVYAYDYTMLVSALTPVPTTRKLARDLPLMKKWGCIGFASETRNQWIEGGITTKYVRARLEWDTHADVKALLDDFFARWYGAAAEPAHAFWDALEERIEATPLLAHEDRVLPWVYTPELLKKVGECVASAEKLAADERSKLHVRVDRLILEHLEAYVAMNAAERRGEFAAAATQADRMMALRKELTAISPFFVLDHEKPYDCGVWYWGVTARAEEHRKLAALGDGTQGKLVLLLPETARFHLDPHDDGRFERWYERSRDVTTWRAVLTTKPFYAQGCMDEAGHPYVGYAWYRFDVDVPAIAPGQRVHFLCPVVETEGWCWVNGVYVGHRPYAESYTRPSEMDLDVTDALEPGKTNTIAIRIGTSQNPEAAAGGLTSRCFLYAKDPSR